MKLYFSEEQLGGKRTNLVVSVSDINPLMKEFHTILLKSRSGDYLINVDKFNSVTEPNQARIIYSGVHATDEIEKIKTTFKLTLKKELEKGGLYKGLSEEKAK